MEKYFDKIKKSPVFAGLSDEEIRAFLTCSNSKTDSVKKGGFIFREGDGISRFGLLLGGEALIIHEDFWGNRNIISRVVPPQLFAETFAFSSGKTLSVSVVAESDCTFMLFDVEKMMFPCASVCAHHGKIIRNLLSDMANKNIRMNEKLLHMAKRSTREKLLSYLSSVSEAKGKNEFDIPFSRQQLADYLSVDRSAMSAELSKMKNEGIIDCEKNHFVIKT